MLLKLIESSTLAHNRPVYNVNCRTSQEHAAHIVQQDMWAEHFYAKSRQVNCLPRRRWCFRVFTNVVAFHCFICIQIMRTCRLLQMYKNTSINGRRCTTVQRQIHFHILLHSTLWLDLTNLLFCELWDRIKSFPPYKSSLLTVLVRCILNRQRSTCRDHLPTPTPVRR